MYHKILVPVAFDHRETAPLALKVARALSGDQAQIILFHALEEIPAFVASQIPRDIVAESQSKVGQELEEMAKVAGPNVTVSMTKGHASRAILDFASQNGVDCIVISSHRPGLEDYFLGSTAARVVRHAECAVHVIR